MGRSGLAGLVLVLSSVALAGPAQALPCNPFCELVMVKLSGNCDAVVAVCLEGNSEGVVAVSGGGNSEGTSGPMGLDGPLSEGLVALSLEGNAQAGAVAVSLCGNADGLVAVEGGDAAEPLCALGEASLPRAQTVPGALALG